jgi:protein-disulfide isomerase
MRRFALALSLCLMPVATLAGGLGEMTTAEKDAFRAEVRQYLLDNPEVIIEAMDVLQSRKADAQQQADVDLLRSNADAIFNDPASWVGGNPNGSVTIVEFMDYRCGYCRKAYSEVENLVKADGDIRFVVKELPILGDDSLISAKFAIAMRMLHGDEAYKAAHDALIDLRGAPDAETLGRLASDLGYDAAEVTATMESADVLAVIQANHDLAGALNITGTPTFVIDTKMLRGYLPEADMQVIVTQERAS